MPWVLIIRGLLMFLSLLLAFLDKAYSLHGEAALTEAQREDGNDLIYRMRRPTSMLCLMGCDANGIPRVRHKPGLFRSVWRSWVGR